MTKGDFGATDPDVNERLGAIWEELQRHFDFDDNHEINEVSYLSSTNKIIGITISFDLCSESFWKGSFC